MTSKSTTSQEDYAIAAKEMVKDFSRATITNERLLELHNLIESESLTNRTIHFFRSLNDIPRSKRPYLVKKTLNQTSASASWYDLLTSRRLDFLYVLYWMLSNDTRMYILYDYIHERIKSSSDSGELSPSIFHRPLVSHEDGDTLVSLQYTDLMGDISALDNQLDPTKGGQGLEATLCQYRGRPI